MDSLVRAYETLVNASGYNSIQTLLDWGAPRRFSEKGAQLGPRRAQEIEIALEPFSNTGVVAAPREGEVPTVDRILIHGSQATGDTCDFSDVDILVILDDIHDFSQQAHLTSVWALKHMLAQIYVYDPLMHHGLMFLPSSELSAYDERFLPIETLRTSRVLYGPPNLRLSNGSSNARLDSARLRNAVQSLRAQLRGGRHLQGDYQLKNFISGVLLLPALYLATQGTFVYKRESFDLARAHFSTAAWTFISLAEQIRSKWLRPKDEHWRVQLGKIGHPRIRTLLSARIPSRVNIRRSDISALTTGMDNSANTFFAELEGMLV